MRKIEKMDASAKAGELVKKVYSNYCAIIGL